MTPDIAIRNADAQTRLSTYLNDHLGGSATGRGLARRLLEQNRGNEYGTVIEQVLPQIEEDVKTLLEVMRRLEVEPDRIKEALGRAAERLGRLKLNGQLLGYSPLSRLVELEGLALGVAGKLAMWKALHRALGTDPRLEGIDFPQLMERAKDQRLKLEKMRQQSAVEALT